MVIDTVGGSAALAAGIDMLRSGGRFCSFSLSHEFVAGFSTFPIYFKELTIIGSRGLTHEDMQPSIDLVASGAVDVSGFVTATYPLVQSAAALAAYERDASRVLRIVIDVAA
ncbi:MAG: zinc-binding dehydrogenase, partial [Variibacter sp.]|nr:zinc-binding dehydrogenase [Variibacter sp.]